MLVDSTGIQIYGAGQWLKEEHGAKSRRGWRKLHLALDADSGEIIAHTLTDQETGDISQVEPLLNQINHEIGQFTADGAYDGDPTYDAVMRHSAEARIVVPPRSNAAERAESEARSQRDDHIASIDKDGRLGWQRSTGYGKRALVETAIGSTQEDHRATLAGTMVSGSTHRGRHRLLCPQSHAGMRMPEIRSAQDEDKMTTLS